MNAISPEDVVTMELAQKIAGSIEAVRADLIQLRSRLSTAAFDTDDRTKHAKAMRGCAWSMLTVGIRPYLDPQRLRNYVSAIEAGWEWPD